MNTACEDQVLVALIDHSTKKPNSKWHMPLMDPQHAYKPKYSTPQRPASAQPGRPTLWALQLSPPFGGDVPVIQFHWILLPRSKD